MKREPLLAGAKMAAPKTFKRRRTVLELEAELEQRTAERDAALAREAATAEVLGVINSSPGDLTPVFDAMLEKAMGLCEAAFGVMHTYDGQRLKLVAKYGLPPRFAEFAADPTHQPGPGGATPRMLAGAPLVHIPDLKDEEAYRSGDPYRVALVDLGGARTLLTVPLRKDGAFVGQMAIYRQEVRPYSDKQVALLQNFAAQAVIAMENARLITETREALDQQTATAEVLEVINASPGNLTPVFDAMLSKAMQLCEAAFGWLDTFDGERFHTVTMCGVPPEFAKFRTQSPPNYGPGTVPQRLLAGGGFVHVIDLTEEEAYRAGEPNRRAAVELGGARTAVVVALRKDQTLLGLICVFRQEVRPFTDKQVALLQNFAAQAVVAIENARLLTETREALEQQTATAEVLQVINASPGDLTPVFDKIVERAMELCGAAFGTMVIAEGEQFRTVSARAVPAEYADFRHRNPVPPGHQGIAAAIRAGEPIVHTLDLKDTDLYRSGDDRRRALVDLGGARTCLVANLTKDADVLGAIQIYRQEVRPFSESDITVLQNFAAQAVIAMENARLLGELRQRTADLQESLGYQTATSDVLKVISGSTFDVQPVFETISETATRLCDADFALFSRREGDAYRVVATFAFSPEFDTFIRGRLLPTGRGSLSSRVAAEGQVVHIDDVAADSDYAVPETVTLARARTVLGVPLLREGAVIGVIALARKRVQPFAERQIELVRTFADQAVIAIENARLLDELRQRTEEVAELNRGLEARVAEQVDELGRVGRLKRFLAPQLAEMIVSHGDENILESHRREIVVVFCDLRGYTAFTETAEPEEVLDFLREYHGALGPLVSQFEGTLDQFSGDGIMVFFNDPVPIPDPAERAVNMAVAMREAAGLLIAQWRRRDRDLGFGAGIAQGYATLGQIGFSERSGYTAIGTVCNLAARLCAEAKDGQILITGRVAAAAENAIQLEDLGSLALRGLSQPVSTFNVPLTASQPALRVIEGGPASD